MSEKSYKELQKIDTEKLKGGKVNVEKLKKSIKEKVRTLRDDNSVRK